MKRCVVSARRGTSSPSLPQRALTRTDASLASSRKARRAWLTESRLQLAGISPTRKASPSPRYTSPCRLEPEQAREKSPIAALDQRRRLPVNVERAGGLLRREPDFR